MQNQKKKVVIDGENLEVADVIKVAVKYNKIEEQFQPVVEISEAKREKLEETREYIENNWLNENSPTIYGFNTGVGVLKDERINTEEIKQFQKLLIESHSAGIGEPAPEEVSRATLLLRANALTRGFSGIRVEVIDRLLAMLNRGIHPIIPQQGSVGASGDLAPMAHVTAALVGHKEAEVIYNGEKRSARKAFELAGLDPHFEMKAKDVLAMINGCSFSLAYAVLVLNRSKKLVQKANLAAAMSMEAMRGELDALDERIQRARNQKGQIEIAARMRELLKNSEWTGEKARGVELPYSQEEDHEKARVQDAYALRCIPQVHGASLDVIKFAEDILTREMNAATDNPLIFAGDDGYEALSGGNFHGQYLAYAMDNLAVAVHELGNISERRSSRMLDPGLSYGLPPNLVGDKVGLNTGFTLAQCAASSLVSENKRMCFPSSADSIPTKNNQEDHVSMATIAARKSKEIAENTEKIIAIEFLCAAQGISLIEDKLEEFDLAAATGQAYKKIRDEIPAMKEDRFVSKQMETIHEMIKEDCLI